VSDLFSRFNVVITDVEPTSGDYVEAVVAGTPNEIGMPWGVGGVAPFDPYSCGVIPDAIVYAFAGVYIDPGYSGGERSLCETTAQEIAHAFGLDHELLCEDPMTYLDGCGAKEFQDVYAACGEFEERECSCNRASQNSVQEMFEKLGATEGYEPPPPPNDLEAPKVALLSPEDGAALVGDTTITVSGTATDDIGLVSVELVWEYNGDEFALPCPGQGQTWSCSRDGANVTWQVEAGLGSRTVQIRARDVMGKTAETERHTFWLSEDGSPAPVDNYEPEVRIVTPADGAVLPAYSPVQVVVVASDDTGIASVELDWVYSGRSFGCPREGRVSCEIEGSTYIWTLDVGDGSRTFSARATDLLGNTTVTAQRTFTLSNEAAPQEDISNDTYDFATELSCGDSVRLSTNPGEEDWFEIETPDDGTRVRVQVTGEVAENLQVTAATGPHSSQIAADADGAPSLTYDTTDIEEDVRVRVRPRTESGEYSLEVQCLPPYVAPELFMPPAAGCSSTGDADAAPPTGFALAGLLFLVLPFARRRRK
jgi:MYXO-CTERM domain-containing protein